ncbi:Copper transport protein family [Trifolium repens]|nr:Copper transport protein family [Trifolium repens]
MVEEVNVGDGDDDAYKERKKSSKMIQSGAQLSGRGLMRESSYCEQKIVVKVHMSCQKCRTKALKVAAATYGVNFVGLEGEDKDKLVVIGDGVDAVKLTNCLRKKVGHTEIVSLREVKAS